ncbi:MAG: hypothetical protein DSY98_01920 [SAR324 cluster bacterium]|jgi:hypothetical protein|uniref:Uncharacterized protein n=1 Tax=SAR324 cluster bacterium TaxID=2024889 RepID=A0A432GDR8_9DELT|nr:MAG: hypothetical protein DSY98_01920 [SAR324 cluster bacterium]
MKKILLGLLKEVEGYIFSYIYSLKNVEEVRTKKSHIHILESETLSRESRVTETAQEIVGSIPYNCA